LTALVTSLGAHVVSDDITQNNAVHVIQRGIESVIENIVFEFSAATRHIIGRIHSFKNVMMIGF